jgi:hypothetical protein
VHHAVGISLLVFVIGLVSGLLVAGVRGLGAWRALRSFKATTADAMLETAVRIEALEARMEASAGRAERMADAQAQLRRSMAEAKVIGEAAGEVWDLVERARVLVPPH